MASITCPECKKHMSVFEVVCFNCGFIMTDEERDRQLKELEKQRYEDSLKENSPPKGVLKHPREHKLEKKLNTISLGFFKIGWAEMVVPLIIILLIIMVILLMFM